MSATVLKRAPVGVVVHDGPWSDACDRYVASHPDASAYHAPAWLDIVRRAFGHETRYFVAESEGAVAGVLPLVLFNSRIFGRFGVSVPFFNYGGVLADSDAAARALLEHAVVETRKAGGRHLELRHRGKQRFPELAARRHKVAMELTLEGTPALQWQALDRKVRNQIRKAEKSGLTAEEGRIELLEPFYAVFAHNMRDLGTPVYGVRFFKEILSTFPDTTRVFLVRAGDGRPLAASIVHWHGTTIEIPWASSIREFNPLCANVLLYWRMLQFASERGFRRLDFGRSTPDEGTFHFKRQWGAQPSALVWEYWTDERRPVRTVNAANPAFGLAIKAWQRLPLAIARSLGPHIVRNIP